VVAGVRQRPAQFGAPAGDRLPRPRIDQVEREPVEQPRRQPDRGQRLRRRVAAAEKRQRGVVQRLHAQRHPVDPGGPEAREPAGLGGGRVGLQRDLDVRRHRPARRDPVEHRRRRLRRHQRGRAAAKEHRRDRPPGRFGCEMIQLGKQRGAPAVLVDRFADVGVEVAVRALRPAERPVHVDPEAGPGRIAAPGRGVRCGAGAGPRHRRRGHDTKQRATSRRKASARWLMACLPAGAISPNVSSRPSGTKIGS